MIEMPRPKQLVPRGSLTVEQIQAAEYVGSAEHKVERWWGGRPEAWLDRKGKASRPKKQNTTICRKVGEEDRKTATVWVRAALALCQFRFFEGCKTYPKHIWYKDDDGQFWFGFAVNQIAGTYKGWPISETEKREAFD